MFNELSNDQSLWGQYQFWVFTYNTGNPVVYSAGILAEGLRKTVQELDPEGKDPALRKMIVIGHSQGGLLTKLTVVDTGNKIWEAVSDEPFEEFAGIAGGKRDFEAERLLYPCSFSQEGCLHLHAPWG